MVDASMGIPFDYLTNKFIKLDSVNQELVGQKEAILSNVEDVINITKMIEVCRVTKKTKMNDTSSRSHCVIEMKMYIV